MCRNPASWEEFTGPGADTLPSKVPLTKMKHTQGEAGWEDEAGGSGLGGVTPNPRDRCCPPGGERDPSWWGWEAEQQSQDNTQTVINSHTRPWTKVTTPQTPKWKQP